MMHNDSLQQNAFQNPQPGNPHLQHLVQSLLQNAQNQQGGGFGQAAFGGGQSAAGWGAPQRQLSQHDVSNILQQIAPVLPQIIAQAQQAPNQAMAAFGGNSRSLSPQDVSEVVRQILPIIPQLLQSMPQQNGPWGPAQMGFGQSGQGWQGQAAFGQQPYSPPQYQNQTRPLTPQDVNEIARQLSEVVQQQAYTGQHNGQMRF
jgi:hypothetical protein